MSDLAIVYDALGQQWALAERIARTNFVPAPMRGKPEEVLACILTGQELGIGPMQALRHIHVIQGRPTLSAELMASRVRAAGHRIRTIESTNEAATVEGARSDDPDAPEKITWTIDDAKRANLLGKDNWKQYPQAMLWARAVSALCRRLFGDVLGGVSYTPDELPATTEVAWGEVEVDRDTGEILQESAAGVVTTTPTPAVAPTTSVPTFGSIKRLRTIQAAKELVQQASASYQLHVQAAIVDLYGGMTPREFWAEAELERWKQVLKHAVELHDQQQHETTQMSPMPAAPLPGVGDNTSSRGRAEPTPREGDRATDSVMTPRLDSPPKDGEP